MLRPTMNSRLVVVATAAYELCAGKAAGKIVEPDVRLKMTTLSGRVNGICSICLVLEAQVALISS